MNAVTVHTGVGYLAEINDDKIVLCRPVRRVIDDWKVVGWFERTSQVHSEAFLQRSTIIT